MASRRIPRSTEADGDDAPSVDAHGRPLASDGRRVFYDGLSLPQYLAARYPGTDTEVPDEHPDED